MTRPILGVFAPSEHNRGVRFFIFDVDIPVLQHSNGLNLTNIVESSANDSSIIIQIEGFSFNIGILLDETNYDVWYQLREMHIAEKQKFHFIQGSTPIPKDGIPEFDKWYPDNQKVKCWLLMSMKPEIRNVTFVFLR